LAKEEANQKSAKSAVAKAEKHVEAAEKTAQEQAGEALRELLINTEDAECIPGQGGDCDATSDITKITKASIIEAMLATNQVELDQNAKGDINNDGIAYWATLPVMYLPVEGCAISCQESPACETGLCRRDCIKICNSAFQGAVNGTAFEATCTSKKLVICDNKQHCEQLGETACTHLKAAKIPEPESNSITQKQIELKWEVLSKPGSACPQIGTFNSYCKSSAVIG